MICAIHQPNFFPWLGYFDKIGRADLLVFLDGVERGGAASWISRVRLDVQGRSAWVGCPLKRASRSQLIKDVRIEDAHHWRRDLVRTLEVNYKRSPGYERAMSVIVPLIEYPSDWLVEFNTHAILALVRELGTAGRFVRQSELAIEGRGTALLVALVKAVGADTYLCGGGAAGYQEDSLFAEAGIEVAYQSFVPAPYGDPARFISGLSVIDYLMRGEVPGWRG